MFTLPHLFHLVSFEMSARALVSMSRASGSDRFNIADEDSSPLGSRYLHEEEMKLFSIAPFFKLSFARTCLIGKFCVREKERGISRPKNKSLQSKLNRAIKWNAVFKQRMNAEKETVNSIVIEWSFSMKQCAKCLSLLSVLLLYYLASQVVSGNLRTVSEKALSSLCI